MMPAFSKDPSVLRTPPLIQGRSRGHDVGAVQASAHTYFDDSDVDLLAGEVVKGEADGHLEEGKVFFSDE